MRSYSRKRPDNQLIENVHSLCRLCLTKAEDSMPIFIEGSDNICATLALRIMICVGLEMTREECLPNIICKECYKELDRYYTFRKKCEVTYQKLKSHAMAVKEKQNKDKVEKVVEKKEMSMVDLESIVVTFDSDQFAEVTELNLNGVAQANHFADTLPDMATEDAEIRIAEDNNTMEQSLPVVMSTEDGIEIKISEDNNTMEQTVPENTTTTMVTENSKEIKIPEDNNGMEQTLLDNTVITKDNIEIGIPEDNNAMEQTLPVMTTEDGIEIRIPEDSNTMEQTLPIMTTEDGIEIRIPEDNNAMEQTQPLITTEDGIEIRIPEDNNAMEQTQPFITTEDGIEIRIPEDNNAMEQEPEDIDTLDLDVTTFLSSMLIELGILTQHEAGLQHNQHVRTLELETGDGSQLTLEIVEEDEDEQNQDVEQLAEEVPPAVAPPEESDAATDQEIVIKYVESKVSNKFPSDSKGNGMWCDECGKRYASRSALTRHSRVHSGERPFACKLCARRFSQREVMLRHMLVHEARRPYACSECNKSFTQRAALALHARRHAPTHARALALHRCDRCPKVFLHASGLSRHIMMHNGRVFMCGACERQFKDKSSLLRHLKNTNHAVIDNADT